MLVGAVEGIDDVGKRGADGRAGEVGVGFGEPAATAKPGVHVELELELERVVRIAEAERLHEEEQGFDGAEAAGDVLLGAEQVSAFPGHGQADTATPAADGAGHVTGLGPGAVEEEYLDPGGILIGGGRIAGRVENPEFAIRQADCGGIDGAVVVPEVAARGGDGPLDEMAG